jgi:LPXTG-motif cell wall-anchored protein
MLKLVKKMKKSILVFSMVSLLLAGGLKSGLAQDQPKPKKDTVNIDTDAKPTFYYAEDEAKSKSKFPTIPVVGGVVVLLAAGAFLVLRKKK